MAQRLKDRSVQYSRVLLLFGGVLLAQLLGCVRLPNALATAACLVLGRLLTMAVFFFWMLSMRERLTQKYIRGCLCASVGLILVCLFVRFAIRDFLFDTPTLQRYLWYVCFLALLLLPLLRLFAALCAGRAEDDRVPGLLRLLYLPALALFLCVMTNDRHQLVFRFSNAASSSATYACGPLFWLIAGWAAVLLILSLVVLVRRCRLPDKGRRVLAPLAVLLLGGGVLLLKALPGASGSIDTAAVLCVIDAALWESCVGSGLILSNSRFGKLFAKTTLRAQIVDQNGNRRYAAEDALPLTREQVQLAVRAPVMLNDDARLNASPIGGGYVLWTEDLTDAHRTIREIERAVAGLDESNRALSKENGIRRQLLEVQEQNRLYAKLAESVSDKLAEVQALLDRIDRGEEPPQSLARVCVFCAYIKRKINLLLLAETNETLPSHEWDYAVRESLDYAALCGLRAALEPLPPRMLLSHALVEGYDRFEAALEQAMATGGDWRVLPTEVDGYLTLRFLPDTAGKAGDAPHA